MSDMVVESSTEDWWVLSSQSSGGLHPVCRVGFRTGQAGPPQPGGGGGRSTYVLSPFIVLAFWVGWASTAPLLKAAQGPPHV